MKNFKFKTFSACFFSGLISASALTSCVNSQRNSFISILLPFRTNSNQYIAFKNIADAYNKQLNTHKLDAQLGYLPLRINSFYGYDEVVNNIAGNLVTNNNANLPNLSFGYPEGVYEVAINHRQLDFSQPTSYQLHGKQLPPVSVDPSQFNKHFLLANQRISNSDPKGLYLLPNNISLDTLYVSKPVMHYIFQQLVDHGLSIAESSQDFFWTNFGVKNKGASLTGEHYQPSTTKIDKLKKQLGTLTNQKVQEAFGANYQIQQTIFTNYQDLFTFSKNVSVAFNLLHQSGDKRFYINGINGFASEISNQLLEMTYGLLKGNDQAFLWKRDHTTNTINYQTLLEHDQNSDAIKSLKQAYELVTSVMKSGGSWTPNNVTPFFNTPFKQLRMGWGIGSSSGAGYLYDVDEQSNNLTAQDLLVLIAPEKYHESDQKKTIRIRGGRIYGLSFNNKLDYATKLFINWLQTTAWTQQTPNTPTITMADYYAIKSGYVPGSNRFLAANSNNDHMFHNTLGSEFAYKYLKNFLNNNSDYQVYAPPVGYLTHQIELTITSSFLNANHSPISFESLINNILENNYVASYLKSSANKAKVR